jgi:hypothetical protein
VRGVCPRKGRVSRVAFSLETGPDSTVVSAGMPVDFA